MLVRRLVLVSQPLVDLDDALLLLLLLLPFLFLLLLLQLNDFLELALHLLRLLLHLHDGFVFLLLQGDLLHLLLLLVLLLALLDLWQPLSLVSTLDFFVVLFLFLDFLGLPHFLEFQVLHFILLLGFSLLLSYEVVIFELFLQFCVSELHLLVLRPLELLIDLLLRQAFGLNAIQLRRALILLLRSNSLRYLSLLERTLN